MVDIHSTKSYGVIGKCKQTFEVWPTLTNNSVSIVSSNFIPKKLIYGKRSCWLSSDILQKLSPSSLYIYISHCTNGGIEIYKQSNKRLKETEKGEIQLMVGCTVICATKSNSSNK